MTRRGQSRGTNGVAGSPGRRVSAPAVDTMPSGSAAPAAARALRVFEVFARENRELTMSEMARLLGLPESSTSDLLSTLRDLGYLSRSATTRRFYPTRRLQAVAAGVTRNDAFSVFGEEAASLLARRTGESAGCAVFDGDDVKFIAVAHGHYRLHYVMEIGDRLEIHAAAISKALLATVDEERMQALLRRAPLPALTARTRTDPDEIEAEIREHRRLGWYQARDEWVAGASSLAVAGEVGGEPVGVGLVGPTERIRLNEAELLETLAEVRATVFG